MIGISGMTMMDGMTCMTMPEGRGGGGGLRFLSDRDDRRIFLGRKILASIFWGSWI